MSTLWGGKITYLHQWTHFEEANVNSFDVAFAYNEEKPSDGLLACSWIALSTNRQIGEPRWFISQQIKDENATLEEWYWQGWLWEQWFQDTSILTKSQHLQLSPIIYNSNLNVLIATPIKKGHGHEKNITFLSLQ